MGINYSMLICLDFHTGPLTLKPLLSTAAPSRSVRYEGEVGIRYISQGRQERDPTEMTKMITLEQSPGDLHMSSEYNEMG